ncbi:RDD family protein [Viridibacillus arvi]|uniref:RDD family protein n=1 Tax=Viridibacillus arvi TaxID=263475 RepID=UPI0034CF42BF
MKYVGFWKRFLSYTIDYLVVGSLSFILSIVFSFAFPSTFAGVLLIQLLIDVCYYALLESSSLQGTLGKRALGIIVVDKNGDRISIGTAVIRFLIKTFLSPIFCIGFIMAAFTEKKQGLHDLIAKTYCVER